MWQFLKQVDWGTVASITTAIALFIAIVTLIYQIREDRKAKEFVAFAKYQEVFTELKNERWKTWRKIKDVVLANPKLKHEIPDKSVGIDYIKLRIGQAENLFAIEHSYLEQDIRSLNILNEICRYALRDEQKLNMVKIMYSHEISYYQRSIKDIIQARNHCTKERLMTAPQYQAVMKIKIDDHFGRP